MSDAPGENEPLSYAHVAPKLTTKVRPSVLMVPNLAAVMTIFLKLTGSESPFDVISTAVFSGISTQHFWEGMLTAPFLLSIPLVLWTGRLCLRPHVRKTERIIASCVSITAGAMTVLAIGYCGYLSIGNSRFAVPMAIASMAVVVLAVSLWKLMPFVETYVPAFFAMTGAFATNTLLTVLVVTQHSAWRFGSIFDLTVAIAQFIAMIVLVRQCQIAMKGSV